MSAEVRLLPGGTLHVPPSAQLLFMRRP